MANKKSIPKKGNKDPGYPKYSVKQLGDGWFVAMHLGPFLTIPLTNLMSKKQATFILKQCPPDGCSTGVIHTNGETGSSVSK